jgi:hypothetical protein
MSVRRDRRQERVHERCLVVVERIPVNRVIDDVDAVPTVREEDGINLARRALPQQPVVGRRGRLEAYLGGKESRHLGQEQGGHQVRLGASARSALEIVIRGDTVNKLTSGVRRRSTASRT